MDKKKVVEFVKTHKKDIIWGTTTAIVGTIGVVLFKKTYCEKQAIVNALQNSCKNLQAEMDERISKLDWKLGKMTDLWNEGEYTNAIVNEIPISKLGELGNEFKKLEGITDDTMTDIVIGFNKVEI